MLNKMQHLYNKYTLSVFMCYIVTKISQFDSTYVFNIFNSSVHVHVIPMSTIDQINLIVAHNSTIIHSVSCPNHSLTQNKTVQTNSFRAPTKIIIAPSPIKGQIRDENPLRKPHTENWFKAIDVRRFTKLDFLSDFKRFEERWNREKKMLYIRVYGYIYNIYLYMYKEAAENYVRFKWFNQRRRRRWRACHTRIVEFEVRLFYIAFGSRL